jgi:hypothetical protein
VSPAFGACFGNVAWWRPALENISLRDASAGRLWGLVSAATQNLTREISGEFAIFVDDPPVHDYRVHAF